MSVRIKNYSNLGIEKTETTNQVNEQQEIVDNEGYHYFVGQNDAINFLDDARGDNIAVQTNQNLVKDKIPFGSEKS
jgi:hypothetical protein